MAPEAVETNDSPNANSGLLKPVQADGTWTPEDALSSLPEQPQQNSTSPVPFFHILERLKTTKREGWRRFGISHGESISDHMYRMAIITMLCPPSLASRIDIAKCTKMALVHDMAEALVGDITPVDGVTKSEKSRRETTTMSYLTSNLLSSANAPAGQSIREIWQEYEDSQTLESHFVHDVDKMELLLQMLEYERAHDVKIDFHYVAGKIILPEVKAWAEEVLEERRQFFEAKGVKDPNAVVMPEGIKKQQDEYYERDTTGATVHGHGHGGGEAQA